MTDLTAKEWRRKWIEALRSGKYRQTTGTLRDRDGFCCLGVLCDISEKGKWVREEEDECWYFEGLHHSDFATLPKPVQQLVGLRTISGRISKSEGHDLSLMNDAGCSFARIADIIEAEPEELFD